MCFQLKNGKTWTVNVLLLLHLNVPGCDPSALPGLWCLWDLTPVLQEEVECIARFFQAFYQLTFPDSILLEIHCIDAVVVTLLCCGLKRNVTKKLSAACTFCFINERGLQCCDDGRSVPTLATSCTSCSSMGIPFFWRESN